MLSDDEECDVVVVAVQPYGLDVTLPDGGPGMIDNAKDLTWETAGRDTVVGTTIHTVVLDDSRVPMRLSALPSDMDIARTLRGSA